MPANLTAFILFIAMQSQWRATAFALIGLDYTALEFVARVKGIELTAELFQKIQILEFDQLNQQSG